MLFQLSFIGQGRVCKYRPDMVAGVIRFDAPGHLPDAALPVLFDKMPDAAMKPICCIFATIGHK